MLLYATLVGYTSICKDAFPASFGGMMFVMCDILAEQSMWRPRTCFCHAKAGRVV